MQLDNALQKKLDLLQNSLGVECIVTFREERDDFDGSVQYTGLLELKNQMFESMGEHRTPIHAVEEVILFALDYFDVQKCNNTVPEEDSKAIAKLSRFAHNNKLSVEWKLLSEDRSTGYSYQVTVGGLSFVSDTRPKKKEAKNDAALV
jgi:hypothetical protein